MRWLHSVPTGLPELPVSGSGLASTPQAGGAASVGSDPCGARSHPRPPVAGWRLQDIRTSLKSHLQQRRLHAFSIAARMSGREVRPSRLLIGHSSYLKTLVDNSIYIYDLELLPKSNTGETIALIASATRLRRIPTATRTPSRSRAPPRVPSAIPRGRRARARAPASHGEGSCHRGRRPCVG